MKLIETRTIDTDKVRGLCISHNYYTRGTTEEYSAMFKMCMKDCGVLEIAQDIMQHSDKEGLMYQYGCTETELLEEICFELINDCSYTTVEIAE